MKKSKFFRDLSQMDFLAIIRCLKGRIKEFHKDEIIEYEGQPALSAYLVLTGELKTVFFDEEGYSIPSQVYKPDSIFGLEYNNIKTQPFTEELYASADSTVLILDVKRIFSPCQNHCLRHSIFIKECIKELILGLENTKKRTRELGQRKSKDKVLTYLTHALPKKGVTYVIPYSRQEMADYLGLERSALSKVLSDLKKDGFIDFCKSSFTRFK